MLSDDSQGTDAGGCLLSPQWWSVMMAPPKMSLTVGSRSQPPSSLPLCGGPPKSTGVSIGQAALHLPLTEGQTQVHGHVSRPVISQVRVLSRWEPPRNRFTGHDGR